MNDKPKSTESRLNSLLNLGHECARALNAKCVSSQLSKSYSEESLRFTCQNGHNFFLSIAKLKETHTTLTSSGALTDKLRDGLTWCNKCAKFYAKVKNLCPRLRLDILGGLFDKRIELRCKRGNHTFSISYAKKLEQISCLRCRSEDKEQVRENLRLEEELRNEKLRLEQEKVYAEAKLLMDKELLLRNRANAANNLRSNCAPGPSGAPSCTYSPCCQCLSCNRLRANTTDASRLDSSEYLRSLEQSINAKATSLAKAFLASLSESERADEKLSYQKVFLVLKFNETPEDVLLAGMKLMGDSEQTRSYFKTCARLVHPDKNGHPLANTVFQKLHTVTQLAVSSFAQAPKTRYDYFKQDARQQDAYRWSGSAGATSFRAPATSM